MTNKNTSAKIATGLSLEEIKRVAVTAMFADDELFDHLVLKGGNALNLIHRLGTRASIDLDFSMQHDWPEGVDEFSARVGRTLNKTFRLNGYEVFDVKMEEKPKTISADMADFWGGYAVEFKLIPLALYEKHATDIDELRKHAVMLGQGKKFLIDVSRFEYTYGKQEADLDGYRIYVYSPQMIVCEKLRAICQQMPEYGPVIKRSRPGTARARDFVDIHVLMTNLCIDITSEQTMETLSGMFQVKKVPLAFLGRIEAYREFHRADFPAVLATVNADTKLEKFDFYFEFVLDLVAKLKPFWNV
jgi:hypothetical protein